MPGKIIDAIDAYRRPGLSLGATAPAEFALRAHWPTGVKFSVPLGVAPKPSAVAFINHGRWLAACPFCGNVLYVTPDDPRLFCVSGVGSCCLNAKVGGQWVAVAFPAERVVIEAALLERPQARFRHWTSTETVEDLRRENRGELVRWPAVLAHRAGEITDAELDKFYLEE